MPKSISPGLISPASQRSRASTVKLRLSDSSAPAPDRFPKSLRSRLVRAADTREGYRISNVLIRQDRFNAK
jgi:hypothetical protein